MIINELTLRLVLRHLPSMAVSLFDTQGRYVVSEGATYLDFGVTPKSLEGRLVGEPSASVAGLVPVVHKVRRAVEAALEGSTTDFELSYGDKFYDCHCGPVLDEGELTGGVIVIRDVTHRKRNDLQILAYARVDALTGIANRTKFDLFLRRCLNRGGPLALVYLDLNGFKALNDSQGHAAGDECLRAVARVCEESVRVSDLAARLGGDEFAIVLTEAGGRDGARAVVERVQSRVAALPYGVSVAAGVAFFPDDARDAVGLLRIADAEMYQAKKSR